MKLSNQQDNLAAVRDESVMLAQRVFKEAVTGRAHVLWVSSGATFAELSALVTVLDDAPYVGVFRNDAPVDGSRVQIFRSGGQSVKLDPTTR